MAPAQDGALGVSSNDGLRHPEAPLQTRLGTIRLFERTWTPVLAAERKKRLNYNAEQFLPHGPIHT